MTPDLRAQPIMSNSQDQPDDFPTRRRIDDMRTIAHFELLDLLGSGGQGEVYSARDKKLNRSVALKLMSRRLGFFDLFSEGRTKARFEREAEVTAKLDHAGVCSIYEYGVEDGIAWIAMQRVEGESLQTMIARQRAADSSDSTFFGALDSSFQEAATLDAREPESEEEITNDGRPGSPVLTSMSRDDVDTVLALIESAARAVAAANDQGLVHRDLKPGNIMVTPERKAVILDFGLAFDENMEGPSLTATGDVVGTPAYMSPEQLQGDRKRVDRRTDVYSLGVTLFECLSLQRPFEGFSRAQLFREIVESEPASIRKLNPSVPRDVEVVLETALCKDPEGRYRSCHEFADELARIRRREPIIARPASTATKVLRWTQRNPALASLAGVVFLFLTIAVVYTALKNRELSDLNRGLQLATETAEDESRAKGVALKAEAAAAKRNLELVREYERMADLKRLADAELGSDALWPLSGASVPDLDAWLEEHRALMRRLAGHRGALEALRASPGVKVTVEEGDPEAKAKTNSATKTKTKAWSFGDDIETQFRHDSLAQLVADLGGFVESKDGVVSGVRERRRVAASLLANADRASIAEAWSAVARRLTDDLRFSGFEVTRREELIPLGPDPKSKLEEFLHWPTHAWRNASAEIPLRDSDGNLSLPEIRGLVFVLCPPGKTWVGSQNRDPKAPNFDPDSEVVSEDPVNEVSLAAFFLSKYELTQEQWKRLTSSNPSYYDPGLELVGTDFPIVNQMHPVESLSYSEAHPRLLRFGLELPTESQWEYAYRAGRKQRFAGTNRVADVGKFGNLAGSEVTGIIGDSDPRFRDRHGVHAPVGSYLPNAFGLYDMMGNVMEYCRGPYTMLTKPARGPEAIRDSSGHLTVPYRGGSFLSSARYGRAAFRREINPSANDQYLGFRPILQRVDGE